MEGVSNLKRQLSVDLSLCIFCQIFKVTYDVLDASQQGLETGKHAYSIIRKLNDSKDIDAWKISLHQIRLLICCGIKDVMRFLLIRIKLNDYAPSKHLYLNKMLHAVLLLLFLWDLD